MIPTRLGARPALECWYGYAAEDSSNYYRRVADGVKDASHDLASVAEVLSEYGKVGACDLVAEVAYGAIENGTEEIRLFVIEIEMHARSFRVGCATREAAWARQRRGTMRVRPRRRRRSELDGRTYTRVAPIPSRACGPAPAVVSRTR